MNRVVLGGALGDSYQRLSGAFPRKPHHWIATGAGGWASERHQARRRIYRLRQMLAVRPVGLTGHIFFVDEVGCFEWNSDRMIQNVHPDHRFDALMAMFMP